MAIDTKEIKDFPDGGVPADDTVILVQKDNGDYEKTSYGDIKQDILSEVDTVQWTQGTYTPIVSNYQLADWQHIIVREANWIRRDNRMEVSIVLTLRQNNAGANFWTDIVITTPTEWIVSNISEPRPVDGNVTANYGDLGSTSGFNSVACYLRYDGTNIPPELQYTRIRVMIESGDYSSASDKMLLQLNFSYNIRE